MRNARLSNETLKLLPHPVERPRYDRPRYDRGAAASCCCNGQLRVTGACRSASLKKIRRSAIRPRPWPSPEAAGHEHSDAPVKSDRPPKRGRFTLGLGKLPTTSVRRLTSRFNRSAGSLREFLGRYSQSLTRWPPNAVSNTHSPPIRTRVHHFRGLDQQPRRPTHRCRSPDLVPAHRHTWWRTKPTSEIDCKQPATVLR